MRAGNSLKGKRWQQQHIAVCSAAHTIVCRKWEDGCIDGSLPLLLMAHVFFKLLWTRLELLCSWVECGTQPMGGSNERIPPLDWSSTAKSASMKQSRVPMCIRRIFTTVEQHFREIGKGCENRHLQSTQESSFIEAEQENKELMSSLWSKKKSYAMPLTTSIAIFWNSGTLLHTP